MRSQKHTALHAKHDSETSLVRSPRNKTKDPGSFLRRQTLQLLCPIPDLKAAYQFYRASNSLFSYKVIPYG